MNNKSLKVPQIKLLDMTSIEKPRKGLEKTFAFIGNPNNVPLKRCLGYAKQAMNCYSTEGPMSSPV